MKSDNNNLPDPNFKYVTTVEAARRALTVLDRYDEHYIDTETTGLDPYKAKISLLQMGSKNDIFVFDMRYDTDHSEIHPDIIKPILIDKSKTRVLQNASYDMKMIKVNWGYYLKNVYDTMLAEQLLNLGLGFVKTSLDALVLRYIGVLMEKESRKTFADYNQKFELFQLKYAANDVVVLPLIKELQEFKLQKEGLEKVAQLEFDFLIPLCEMELNGIKIDVDKWRIIMKDVEMERNKTKIMIHDILSQTEDQNTLFGMSLLNIDSNLQLKIALNKYGIDVKSTAADVLSKYEGIPVIDDILDYRKAEKLISTYSETLLSKISSVTGRLHSDFRQLLSTGRLASSNPNLQNIPRKQKYRSCFVAEKGYSLITADMAGAELRILGNMSRDPIFIDSFAKGLDLHTVAASLVFNVPYEKVTKSQRAAAKDIQFGLCYGLSKFGLAKRLKITERKADGLIKSYFKSYKVIERFLDKLGKDTLMNRFSMSISGRKRYYTIPDYDDPNRKTIQRTIERCGKNMTIQGSNADVLKTALKYCYNRLKHGKYDARILLSVYDEMIIETKIEQKYEVAKIVKQSIIDGFSRYFSDIPMETTPLLSPCWTKDSCDCGHTEVKFVPDEKYKTKLICDKCGKEQ